MVGSCKPQHRVPRQIKININVVCVQFSTTHTGITQLNNYSKALQTWLLIVGHLKNSFLAGQVASVCVFAALTVKAFFPVSCQR